jgi:hypothetical protein
MKRYLLVLLEAVSAIGAAGAAIGSYTAARATRQAIEVQLYSQIMHEYAAPTMAQSLALLRTWKEQNGPQFAQVYSHRLQAGEADAVQVDHARRQVWFHFVTVLRLYEAGYIPEVFVRQSTCVETDGLEILVEIVKPMREVRKLNTNRAEFARLLQLCHPGPRAERLLPEEDGPASTQP